MFYRWQLCSGKKGGLDVGKTKKGKGTKLMVITDATGLPIALSLTSATPHEVTLVESTLDTRFIEPCPLRLIGDRAYDSDPLDERLAELGIDMIAPHRSSRISPTQDGRKLRRYKRRWKVERLFAWLQTFRRVLTRFDYHIANYKAFVQLACITILLKYF
jgi:transposase